MRFYLELFTRYNKDTVRYICVYVGSAHAKGQNAKLLGFEYWKVKGVKQFRTFPPMKRKKQPLKFEALKQFCEELKDEQRESSAGL